jgi:hypothetical protein
MADARRLSRRRNWHCNLVGYPVFSYRLESHLLHGGLELRRYRLGAETVKISKDMLTVEYDGSFTFCGIYGISPIIEPFGVWTQLQAGQY